MPLSLRQHERIKQRLRKQGSSLAEIACDLAVVKTTVTSVSQGYRRAHRIEATIADKLGSTPQRLWPARYPDHTPAPPEASPTGGLPMT